MENLDKHFRDLVNALFYYQNRVEEMKVDVDILDAQMIALGNLLIKKGVVTQEELKNYTDGVMGMKISEKRREREKNFVEGSVIKTPPGELLSPAEEKRKK